MDLTPYTAFASYFLAGIGYLALFISIYVRVTPFAEFKLIREGNIPAAISLGGAILGFCIPLQRAIAQSLSAADLLIWATIALVVQVVAYLLFVRMLPRFAAKVEEGSVAKSILLAAVAVAVGLINAASMVE